MATKKSKSTLPGKRRMGRPPGTKNKKSAQQSSERPMGRPSGSKNKVKSNYMGLPGIASAVNPTSNIKSKKRRRRNQKKTLSTQNQFQRPGTAALAAIASNIRSTLNRRRNGLKVSNEPLIVVSDGIIINLDVIPLNKVYFSSSKGKKVDLLQL